MLRLPVVDHAFVDGSYSSLTAAAAAHGSLTQPPATSTLPFVSRVAVCPKRGVESAPAGDHAPVAGSKSSAAPRTAPPVPRPPETSTLPFASLTAGKSSRAAAMTPAGAHAAAPSLKTSVEDRIVPPPSTPPATRTAPVANSTCTPPCRADCKVATLVHWPWTCALAAWRLMQRAAKATAAGNNRFMGDSLLLYAAGERRPGPAAVAIHAYAAPAAFSATTQPCKREPQTKSTDSRRDNDSSTSIKTRARSRNALTGIHQMEAGSDLICDSLGSLATLSGSPTAACASATNL